MSDLLSEDELKALSEGVADGSIAVDTGYNTKIKVKNLVCNLVTVTLCLVTVTF